MGLLQPPWLALSTKAAKDILLKQDDINKAAQAMAYSLVSTIHCQAQQYTQYMCESEGCVLVEWEYVAQCNKCIAALKWCLGNVQILPGFQFNNRCVTCMIHSEVRL